MSNKRRAFTLIELLVVIAIIAILAAILFPVFAQAKVAAKKAVDLSNMYQIGLATVMYTNDFDDTYPLQCGYNNTLPDGYLYRWSSQFSLGPYIKNGQIFLSPIDSSYTIQFYSFDNPLPTTRKAYDISYMSNSLSNAWLLNGDGYCSYFPNTTTDCTGPIGPGSWFVNNPQGVSDTAAQDPSSLILYTNGSEQMSDWWGCANTVNTETFGCYGPDLIYGWDAYILASGNYFGVANNDLGLAWRKFANQANYAFSDSHVKTMVPTALLAGPTVLNPKYWLVNPPEAYQ